MRWGLRLQRDDLAVFPDINRRAVHAGGLARDLRGAPERAADGGGKLLGGFIALDAFFHRPSSTFLGRVPELSYTVHVSAKSR